MNKNTILDDQIQEIKKVAKEMQEFCSPAEISESLYKDYLSVLPNGDYKKKIVEDIITNNTQKKVPAEENEVVLYSSEITFMRSLPSKKIKSLFYLLVLWAKRHPHPSGFIKFEYDNIFKNFNETYPDLIIKREDMALLIPYGLEMRSIGSKAAIPCFYLPPLDLEGNCIKITSTNWRMCLEAILHD